MTQETIMGNSLHNKIYLGRRAALLNIKRMQIAGCIGALAMLGAFSCLVLKSI